MTLNITIKASEFVLHSSGSIFWPEKEILLIADVHLGKISHFRKAGFAVPANSIVKNFLQLASVVDQFRPKKIYFLGDLFHSAINNEWELFVEWFGTCESEVILVAGNHDIISPTKYVDICISVVSEIVFDGFLFTHHPTEREGFFNFCGHVHPCVRLQGMGRQFLKLPCFFRKPNQMILPAFGEFTGNYELVPTGDDLIYVVTKDSVIPIERKPD